jgi:hypothetical protein
MAAGRYARPRVQGTRAGSRLVVGLTACRARYGPLISSWTSLFATLNAATGEVMTEARSRHTGADFLAFLRRLDRVYPDQELHVILDNVSTHQTPAVRAWLSRHLRIRFHFTPTSASLDDQVETWFGVLTRQAIRRGSFRSVKELVGVDRPVHLQLERWSHALHLGSRPPTRPSPRPCASRKRLRARTPDHPCSTRGTVKIPRCEDLSLPAPTGKGNRRAFAVGQASMDEVVPRIPRVVRVPGVYVWEEPLTTIALEPLA